MMKQQERLLELPLFQGMSRNDINSVVAHTKFGFQKYARGKTVVADGDVCDSILFLLSGTMTVRSNADDNSYHIVEQLSAPDVLQPERIFGLTQRYTKTFTAATDCHIIRLSKAEVVHLTSLYEIFRINLLNIISTQSQRITHQPWRPLPTSIRSKIVRFIEVHSMRPAGQKVLYVKMETLARLIAESRLNLSRELNRMDEEGLIQITRGIITVPALERLMQ